MKFHVLGIPDTWKDFATYLTGMVAPITAIGTIWITYLVYKLNDNDHKSERYFEKIVDLYCDIQQTQNIIQKEENNVNDIAKVEYENKIRTQVRLMRYYLKRFPDVSHPIKSFDRVLNHLLFEPMNNEYYKALVSEFERFCFYANQDQERPIKPVKDKQGKLVDIDY